MQSRRWAIIDDTGTHIWLNHGAEAAPEYLEALPVALDARQVSAWLVVISGDYWADAEVEVQPARLLTRQVSSAEMVIAAFRRRRTETLSSVGVGAGAHRT
jgi:hypothetical protein